VSDHSKLDLNLLAVLAALADAGSVSKAAVTLGLGQPAVSNSLGRLRVHFGDPLFIRTSGGMAPTPRGAEVVSAARDILQQVKLRLDPEIHFNAAEARRPFTVALSDVGEMVFLPRMLRRLNEMAPHAPLHSVSLRPAELQLAMEAGDVDLAIGYFPDIRAADFFQQRLLTHHFVCLLRADHSIQGNRLTKTEFISLEHAVVHSPGRSQEIFESWIEAQGLSRRIRLRTPHFMSIPRLIAKTDMVVTVPHAVGMEYGHPEYGLKVIDPPLRSPTIELKQHWHRKVHKDVRNIWLRSLVSELFNEESDEW
jgi:DNA-binding transcriptional LysR family regulator